MQQQRFELLRRLGSGAMGVVHEAVDRETGSRIALKTLRTDDPYQLVRFKNEFRALQDLRHPNLVRLGELVEREGEWSFTMELVDGVDFLTWVQPRTVEWNDSDLLDDDDLAVGYHEGRLRRGFSQLARALIALHDLGKVHRDVKPSNILVEPGGRLVLLDFGFVAGVAGDPDLEPGWTVGTPDYMAPEQARGRDAGPPADWYAAGTVLYQALTRTLPFSGSSSDVMMQKQRDEPPPPSAVASYVPEDLDHLCSELLRVMPSQRPTGRDVLQILGTRDTGAGFRRVSRPLDEFVGRELELRQLRAAYRREPGEAAVVSICGESGVGKSSLASKFAAELQHEVPQAVALIGHCYERESVPYKAVDELVDALSRYLMTLPDAEVEALLPGDAALCAKIFPVLRRLAPFARLVEPEEVVGGAPLRSRLFEALRALLRRLAERAPLLLIVEDLHFADADSRALLSALMASPAPPLMLIGTERPGGEPLFPGATRVELTSLTRGEALDLAARLGASDRAQHIADSTLGHPMFIEELVRYSLAGGKTAEVGGLGELFQARLGRLPVGSRHILEVVAVAGQPVEQQIAAQAAGMDFGPFQERVASLRAERLVRTEGVRRNDAIAPFHDTVREAVLQQLARPIRAGVHEALALAFEGTERPDDEALARHWRGAGHVDKARDYTMRSARRAAEAFAFARAADLFRAALELDPSPDTARQLNAELGHVLAADGLAAQAAEAFLAAVEAAPGRTIDTLELRRRAADQLLRGGYVERGFDTLRRVLAGVDLALPTPTTGTLARYVASSALRRLRGTRFTWRDEAQVSREELLRVDVCHAAAMGVGAVDSRLTPLFQARHLELALRAGEPVRVGRALMLEVLATASTGKHDRHVRRTLDQLEHIAERTGDPSLRASGMLARAAVDNFVGRWRPSRELGDRAEELFRTECSDVARELSLTRQLLLTSLFHNGELREADVLLLMCLREADAHSDRHTSSALRLGIRNAQWLARDDPAGARHQIDDALHGWPSKSYYYQHYLGLFARVNVALYEGKAREAWDVLSEQWDAVRRAHLLHMQFVRINMVYSRARAALAVAAVDQGRAPGLVRAALRDARKLVREGPGYAAGYGELIEAGAARLRGRGERAAARYGAAAERFAALEMPLAEQIARRREAELGGGRAVDRADERLLDLGVQAPERFATMFAP